MSQAARSPGTPGTGAPAAAEGQRLDKWLWAARFFKTRQLAAEAINGGKIQVEGQGAKPGRPIRPGARLIIHKDSLVWEIQVLALASQRRPAAEPPSSTRKARLAASAVRPWYGNAGN